MKAILTVLLLFFSINLVSEEECRLTAEYKKARQEAYSYTKRTETPEYKCRESVQKANYWKAIANCEKVNGGKGIGGGCYHLVGYGKYYQEGISDKHCDTLKIEDPEKAYEEYFVYLIKESAIKKCQ